jgi:hypothetical protein
MKINDILVEAPPRTIPTKMAPGDLTKRAQQRNQPVTPSATTLPVQNAPVNNTQPAQPASATSKPGSTGRGFLSGFADQMIGKGQAVSKLLSRPGTVSTTDTWQPETTTQPTTPVPTQQPTIQPSGNAVAQKLATDWKAFVDAGGNAGPALKQQIKQMWLDAGGVRAEGKKNKKTSV